VGRGPVKAYGMAMTGIHMKAWRKTAEAMSVLREPTSSESAAEAVWRSAPARFGRATRRPTRAGPAFMARAYGTMKVSLQPIMTLAQTPSQRE
jgi:hypothetical protein